MNTGQAPGGRPLSGAGGRSEILKARARVLARPLERERIAGETFEVVEFRLAHERYAVEQAAVREVHPLRELTPLPCTPPFVLGIMNVRGQILPIIDIKRFFEVPQTGITDLHMVIIVHADDVELGVLADAVVGMRSIPLETVQPSLPTLTGIRAKYLKGVTDDAVVVLDIAKILTDPKLIVEEEVDG